MYKTRKSFFTITLFSSLLFALASSTANAQITNGLIGYWHFNGNGNDSSGNGRTLSLFGSAGFGSGLFGEALALPGSSNSYAQQALNDTAFDFGPSDFTIQVWFNFNSNSREQTLIEKFAGSTGPGWTLTTPLGTDLQFYSEPNISLNAAESFTTGVWHEAVVTRSGTTFSLYFDGNLAVSGVSSPGPLTTTTNPLLVGKRNSEDGRDFSVDGSLDEIAIWNRALSSTEVADVWNSGKGMLLVPNLASGETCNGLYTGTLNGNLRVSPGQNCVFVDGDVTGNVQQSGGSLTIMQSQVGNNVQINGGGAFTIGAGTTIDGSLLVKGLPTSTGLNQVCGTLIDGDLQFQNNGAPVEIGSLPPSLCGGNLIVGNLMVQNSTAPISAAANVIGVNLTLANNSGPISAGDNVVGSDFMVQNNSAATIINSNVITVDLHIQNNTGPTQVLDNVIDDYLQCGNNTSITGSDNVAGVMQGQCSTF